MQELVCPFRSGVRPVFDFGQMDTSANLRRVAALMRRSAPPGRLWTGARQTKTLGEKPASSLQAALVERMSDPNRNILLQRSVLARTVRRTGLGVDCLYPRGLRIG